MKTKVRKKHTQDKDGGKILLKYETRRMSVGEDEHPFDISGQLLKQEHCGNMGDDVSSWQRCSHSIHSHAHQLNDHMIVSFRSDCDAALFYVYDSNFNTFRFYEASGMRDSEHYETAAGHSATKTIYVVTSVGPTEPRRIISFDLKKMCW